MPPEMKADDSDELLPDCIELVVQSGQASVSMLQRRFRIGYNRAARIIDMMEERGIVRTSGRLQTETGIYDRGGAAQYKRKFTRGKFR